MTVHLSHAVIIRGSTRDRTEANFLVRLAESEVPLRLQKGSPAPDSGSFNPGGPLITTVRQQQTERSKMGRSVFRVVQSGPAR
jgi:hypothetical protein